jgi:RimJ/RimL family protein N-acetyltransferase
VFGGRARPGKDGHVDQNPEIRLEDAGPGSWTIVDGTGAVLGGLSLTGERLEFRVVPSARRRGVATAAVREFSRTALAGGLDRLEMLIPWDAPAAQRVALAAGYTREGVRRGDPEMLVYSRLAGDPDGPAPRLLPDLPGGELSDGVITLRPLGEQDIDFYTELHNVPDVIATSVPPEPKEAGEIHRRCVRAEAHWLAGNRADLVIVETATGARAGEIDLYYQEPPTGQAMIGYSMLPAYRKRGFTSRAAQLLALWVFAETGIARLIAGTLPTNLGSQRVLESAGFTREAYLKSRLPGPAGKRTDDVQFVLLAEDLLAQASGGEADSHA